MRARDLGVCDVIYFFPTLNGIDDDDLPDRMSLPDPLPANTFAHTRPEQWLDSISVRRPSPDRQSPPPSVPHNSFTSLAFSASQDSKSDSSSSTDSSVELTDTDRYHARLAPLYDFPPLLPRPPLLRRESEPVDLLAVFLPPQPAYTQGAQAQAYPWLD